MVLLPQQLPLGISNYYPAGVCQYNPSSVETPPLLYIGLNSFPTPMLAVVTVQLKCHPSKAGLLASFTIPADLNLSSLADKEVYRTNYNQYYQGKGR
jgi:hypothetical protein